MNHHTTKSRIQENPYFFYAYILISSVLLIILLFIDKGEGVILFNDLRGSIFDDIFKFLSSLGEGLYFLLFLLIAAVYRFKYLILGISVYLGSGLVTQILKNIFREPRPSVFFQGSDLVTYVEDFQLHSYNSFPSGHTTGGFAIFLFLAIITKNKPVGLFYLICAWLVGISRVFLVQHFLIDVLFGSLIGIFFTIYIINGFENSDKIKKSEWYNYSLVEKIKKNK
ncbi:MAG: phosphatase PAP2 family protein [Candidatus Kapabacteria bacterium]|jgi:membrane-associated phospholipid phosphatase|nr:phosphatase PAP2 family protein [Candidatus Kapabacteria bacterium]